MLQRISSGGPVSYGKISVLYVLVKRGGVDTGQAFLYPNSHSNHLSLAQ